MKSLSISAVQHQNLLIARDTVSSVLSQENGNIQGTSVMTVV